MIGLFAVVGGGCTGDPAPRWLVVEEPLSLCAAAPYSASLELVAATQSTLAIDVGEVRVPDPQPLPGGIVIIGERSPIDLAIEIRDRDGESLLVGRGPEAAVFEHTNGWYQEDDAHDLLAVSVEVDASAVVTDYYAFGLALTATTEADFELVDDGTQEDPFGSSFGMGCVTDVRLGPCPNRSFIACDPGGPTARTRVTLDRGEIVLDLRSVPIAPENGVPDWMFVGAELHIDDVDVTQAAYADLLFSPKAADGSDGTFGVLAPAELEAAGLGCGVVLGDLGTAVQRALLVDCELRELAALEIVAVERETL